MDFATCKCFSPGCSPVYVAEFPVKGPPASHDGFTVATVEDYIIESNSMWCDQLFSAAFDTSCWPVENAETHRDYYLRISHSYLPPNTSNILTRNSDIIQPFLPYISLRFSTAVKKCGRQTGQDLESHAHLLYNPWLHSTPTTAPYPVPRPTSSQDHRNTTTRTTSPTPPRKIAVQTAAPHQTTPCLPCGANRVVHP